jgi:hypothetical protein
VTAAPQPVNPASTDELLPAGVSGDATPTECAPRRPVGRPQTAAEPARVPEHGFGVPEDVQAPPALRSPSADPAADGCGGPTPGRLPPRGMRGRIERPALPPDLAARERGARPPGWGRDRDRPGW